MMLRKSAILIAILTTLISSFGCRKKTSSPPPPTTSSSQEASQPEEIGKPAQGKMLTDTVIVRPQADFDEQAKKEIDANNMNDELDRLEREIAAEAGGRNIQ